MGVIVSILTVVITFAICGLIAWFIISSTKKQAWEGTVASKGTEEHENEDYVSTSYVVTVNLQDGGQKKVNVTKKFWSELNVGDKLVKEAGKFSPTKA